MSLHNLIIKKLYTFTVIKDKRFISQDKSIVSYTRLSAYMVNNTSEEDISNVIEIIAKQQKLDVMKYDQFEYAFDMLKQSVSWN